MKFLRKPEVEDRVGFSERWIREMEQANKFPKRVLLRPGGRTVVWAEHEVDEWIKARLEAREAA